MDWKEFSKRPFPEGYDFREEMINFPTQDPLARFALYKAIGYAENPEKNQEKFGFEEACAVYQELQNAILLPKEEADQGPLFQQICRVLWRETHLVPCRQIHRERAVYGDTMNSFSTTSNVIFGAEMGREVFGSSGKWGQVATVWVYRQQPERYRGILTSCTGAAQLLKVSYTLGNFLPVPLGFQSRGTGPTRDYWDLALWHIYQYYTSAGDRAGTTWLETLLDRKNPYFHKNIVQCRQWLDAFQSWPEFVAKNFLQDFVNQKQDGDFTEPKELWRGHFSGAVLPDRPQAEEFFVNASAWILARSARMTAALQAGIHSDACPGAGMEERG